MDTFDDCKIRAQNGDSNAQFIVASHYFYGILEDKNYNKAFRLYKVAADSGNIDAMYNTARCYVNGLGTSQNMTKAFLYYKNAAEHGHLKGQRELSNCYYFGDGTQVNVEQSDFWRRSFNEKTKKHLEQHVFRSTGVRVSSVKSLEEHSRLIFDSIIASKRKAQKAAEEAERIRLEEAQKAAEKAERIRLEEARKAAEEAERIRLEEAKKVAEEIERSSHKKLENTNNKKRKQIIYSATGLTALIILILYLYR